MNTPAWMSALLGVIALGLPAQAADNLDTRQVLKTVFNAEVETKLALSGAPEHLRAGATVYVFDKTGYTKTREGSNGFTCLLNRDSFLYASAAFKPTCWDAAGTDSYVPVMLDVGRMLAVGSGIEEVRDAIAAGFKAGRYRSATRTGIAYMVAGDLNLDLSTGAVAKTVFPGHYMIYAPGVTNADVGHSPEASKTNPSLPFVFSSGAGGSELGYLITVPHH
jgi:hypothetical protein